MKRTLMKMTTPRTNPTNFPSIHYQTLHEQHDPEKKPKFQLLCASTKRKMYVLLILSGVALTWIFIYYKLLNHKFELPEPLQQLRKIFGDGKVKGRQGREDLTENIFIPEVTDRSCLKQFSKPRNKTVLHFAVVAHGKRIDQAITALKSITLTTNYHVNFYIFTDYNQIRKQTFKKELESWPAYKELWMLYYLYRLHYPAYVDHRKWINLFKPGASQRLFLAKILVNVDSVIYIDTDVIFLRPPEELWQSFYSFTSTEIAGLAYECQTTRNCWYQMHARHPYVTPFGINSGIMLMNLTRMRKLNWEKNLVSIFNKHEHAPLTFGDQDILNVYFWNHRNYLHILTCDWNFRPLFCDVINTCAQAEANGIAVIHGNQDAFVKSKIQPEFRIIYKIFEDYQFQKNDFQKDVIAKLEKKLSKPIYSAGSCGDIKNSLLKYIKCESTI